MRDLYIRVLTDEASIASLRRIFELLSSGQGGFLFHCTDGKDRTGAVAALLLMALGASEQDIFEDYYTSVLATFSRTEAYVQSLRKENYSEDYIDEIRYCNGIGMNIAEGVRDEIVSRFGSVRNYLGNILSDEQIRLLKERFLEPAADQKGDSL